MSAASSPGSASAPPSGSRSAPSPGPGSAPPSGSGSASSSGSGSASSSGPDSAPPATPDGVLLIDKPAGMSSHDVVAAVKRALGGRVRVGHAGTLDPFATGLLIVLVGRATKSQQRLMELPKRYETVARLGCVSSTGDPEGEITYTGRLPPDPPALPTGQITQRPPRHSAVKIAGVRAYKRARRGETFQTPERIVTVYRFEQLWRVRDASPRAHPGERPRQADSRSQSSEHMQALPEHGEARSERSETLSERAAYAIECSSGTYVRSLIADLHDAYCLELRRTAIGPFAVGEAIAPPRPGTRWEGTDALITLQDALARLPT